MLFLKFQKVPQYIFKCKKKKKINWGEKWLPKKYVNFLSWPKVCVNIIRPVESI